MLRRLLPLLALVSLAAIPLGAGGCHRGDGQGPAYPQPIRDEKEPGESFDTISAVPDTGSSSTEEMTGGTSETEVEIDDDDASDSGGDGDKDGDKSADKSKDGGDDADGDDDGGDEPAEPGDVDIEVEVEP